MKLSSPLEVYDYLPKTNCGECGEATCMAFAAKLIERQEKLEACKPILEDKFRKKYEELSALLAPEIREIVIGTGERAKKIGGEDVMHRHQLTFFNETALIYDVWDTMDEADLVARVKAIAGWQKFYVGEFLKLHGIAVRSTSGDPSKFAACVKKVLENTDLPLVLCSFDPKVLEAGLEVAADKNPLVYAANKDNWKEVAELVRKYEVPVALYAPADLDLLKSMAVTFSEMGINDLVLDPGTYPVGKELEETLQRFLKIRRAGIVEGQKEIAYPLMSVPLTTWMVYDDPIEATYWETVLATVFTIRYADLMILHSIEPYALMIQRTLVDNIYVDPRRPVQVEPGVREIGNPTEDSPVFVTTNFALTYYTVESDLSSNNIDCYIVVVNTEGIGVEAALAGGQLTSAKIKETIEDAKLEEKVKHKTLIIPGLTARISGELEDLTGWKVLVGPVDSGRIPGFLDEKWPPK
ncbi:MAG: acetyl-CoA decarbonylase/synthase complex subunit gamma [Candidatus Syntrophoarchaeum sp. WYZ-LMO15]|nr:MAG: acetyl-CoA decarbonylase/synthase complex subunit gamma [Candidatus Syntrophoarchaeum sp. WYZ-LMO15]